MRFQSFRPPSKALTASLTAVATLSLSVLASAQTQTTVYTENFNSGYTVNNSTLSDQNGWGTNDEDTGGTYTYNGTQTGSIGQSDFIGNVGTFTQGVSTNYAGALGGVYGQAVAPGNGATPVTGVNDGTVTLSHSLPTTTATSVVFSTDFQITQPQLNQTTNQYNAHDTFGFSLTTGTAVGVPVNTGTNTTVTRGINVTFQSDAANDFNFDNVYVGGTKSAYGINLGTNYRYKLTVSVNVTALTYSVTLQTENAAGALTGTVTSVATGTYTGGAITGYAATWALKDPNSTAVANNTLANPTGTNNTAHTDAGTNVLYFDNVVVTVPEPSTYAMFGLGALGAVMMARRSRRARTV